MSKLTLKFQNFSNLSISNKSEDNINEFSGYAIMLHKALIVAWIEANGDMDKSKIPALFVKNQIRNKKTRLHKSYSFFVHSSIIRSCHCFQAS